MLFPSLGISKSARETVCPEPLDVWGPPSSHSVRRTPAWSATVHISIIVTVTTVLVEARTLSFYFWNICIHSRTARDITSLSLYCAESTCHLLSVILRYEVLVILCIFTFGEPPLLSLAFIFPLFLFVLLPKFMGVSVVQPGKKLKKNVGRELVVWVKSPTKECSPVYNCCLPPAVPFPFN